MRAKSNKTKYVCNSRHRLSCAPDCHHSNELAVAVPAVPFPAAKSSTTAYPTRRSLLPLLFSSAPLVFALRFFLPSFLPHVSQPNPQRRSSSSPCRPLRPPARHRHTVARHVPRLQPCPRISCSSPPTPPEPEPPRRPSSSPSRIFLPTRLLPRRRRMGPVFGQLCPGRHLSPRSRWKLLPATRGWCNSFRSLRAA